MVRALMPANLSLAPPRSDSTSDGSVQSGSSTPAARPRSAAIRQPGRDSPRGLWARRTCCNTFRVRLRGRMAAREGPGHGTVSATGAIGAVSPSDDVRREGRTLNSKPGWILATCVVSVAVTPLRGSAQSVPVEETLEARVWTDRGDEPVLQRGEQVRVYYRATHDAYVAIFQIDTNGSVRLLHPRSPDEGHYVRGEIDYRLVFPRSPLWLVEDEPGSQPGFPRSLR